MAEALFGDPTVDERVLVAIASADEASTSMTPYGPMNDRWLRRFADALAETGLVIRTTPAAVPSLGDEMICDRCGRRHGVVWFAPSDVWNEVMRDGDRANADEFGFCCPICFVTLAEERGVTTTGWLVCPFDDGPVDRARQVKLVQESDDSDTAYQDPHTGRAGYLPRGKG